MSAYEGCLLTSVNNKKFMSFKISDNAILQIYNKCLYAEALLNL